MSFLDTLKHLVEHSQVFATDTEKAAHLAELEAAEDLDAVVPHLKELENKVLLSVLPRLQAVEEKLATLAPYQPAHAGAPDQEPEVATTTPPATSTDTRPSVQS